MTDKNTSTAKPAATPAATAPAPATKADTPATPTAAPALNTPSAVVDSTVAQAQTSTGPAATDPEVAAQLEESGEATYYLRPNARHSVLVEGEYKELEGVGTAVKLAKPTFIAFRDKFFTAQEYALFKEQGTISVGGNPADLGYIDHITENATPEDRAAKVAAATGSAVETPGSDAPTDGDVKDDKTA